MEMFRRWRFGVFSALDRATQQLLQLVAVAPRQSQFPLAAVYVGLGEFEEALNWLGRWIAYRSSWMAFVNVEPWWAPFAITRRCPVTTWVVAPPPADSRTHPCGASSRACLCGLPQTGAECRVPTVQRPSPGRPVVQSVLSLRTGASQMMGGAALQPCLDNFPWQ